MPIAVKFDTRDMLYAYSRSLRRLALIPGFSQMEILRAEAGSILKTWAGRTKVSTLKETDRRTRLRAIRQLGYTKAPDRGDVTVNAGFRPAPFGRVWIRVRNGGGRKNFILAMGPDFSAPSGRRGYNAVFNKYRTNPSPTTMRWIANVNDAVEDVQSILPRRLAEGRRAIGLSRQSVVQIADKLGIDLLSVRGQGASAAAITKARAAMATNGRRYQNGSGYQFDRADTSFIDLINRLPYGHKIGMDSTLLRILAGRAKFIETSYQKGAMDSLKGVARAFPNLLTIRSL